MGVILFAVGTHLFWYNIKMYLLFMNIKDILFVILFVVQKVIVQSLNNVCIEDLSVF